uniref:HTH_Tnp_Tc3_1 domain-containing protein n=1 Tax=Heterorhabditis bacteriophora TaxID=37862 RepID=A0A1I7XQ23_HETBA
MDWFQGIILMLSILSSLASLKEYNEGFILQFINRSQELDVSQKCRDSLSRVHSYLLDHDTLEAQRMYYFESFGTGPSKLFLSRDQDRWVYRGYECLLSAGETVYSKSEYPMHYCYSHDDDDKDVFAYSVCIPTPCAEDNNKLLRQWRWMTNPSEGEQPMDFTACTRSRHEKQWYFSCPISFSCINYLFSLIFYSLRHISVLAQVDVWSYATSIFCQEEPQAVNRTPKRSSGMYHVHVWNAILVYGVDIDWPLIYIHTESEPTWRSYGYWLRFYRHRIVRLWPAYLYTVMAVTLRISLSSVRSTGTKTSSSSTVYSTIDVCLGLVLSTAGHSVKQISDVVKRSRKALMNFLRHQEEYGTKKGSGRPSKLNGHGKKEILRAPSNNTISINEIRRTCGIDASKTTVWRMLDKCSNIVRSRMKKCLQLTPGHNGERLLLGQNIHGMRLGNGSTFTNLQN